MRCKYCAQEYPDGFSPREHDDNLRYNGARIELSHEDVEQLKLQWTRDGTRRLNQENRREERRRRENQGNRNNREQHGGHRPHRRHDTNRQSDSSSTGYSGQVNHITEFQ